jgi:phage gpG-like protein
MRIALNIDGAQQAREILAGAGRRLEQPRKPLLEVLAAELQTYLQQHIRDERGPDGPWPPLAPATRRIREYYGHPADSPRLVRAGDLLQSVTTLDLSESAAQVGTLMRYARILQDGGTFTDPKTGRTRTVQAFPFAYLTAREIDDLMTLITEYFFGDESA